PVIPKDFVPFKYFDELGQQYPAVPVEPMGEIKEFLDSKSAKYVELNF
ncbi:cell division protein FtsK, partial [Leuconostoc falkenbergense]|nr:cell division protein FtsK [Leuconostoc falkenbergense]